MDRKGLIELFRKGMNVPPGRQRFRISRCFEITVRPDGVVELDEYEGFASQPAADRPSDGFGAGRPEEMFHVGRSVLDLKDGRVTEERGRGWNKRPGTKCLDNRCSGCYVLWCLNVGQSLESVFDSGVKT